MSPLFGTWWWPRWRVPSFLMLHSVSDDIPPDCPANNAVRPRELEAFVSAMLHKGYRFGTFDEVVRSADRRDVCLTFDDGFADNAANLMPILARHNARATCFVTNRGTRDARYLSARQIREMQATGLVEFGGHTAHHRWLDALPPAAALAEITDNKHWLEDVLGRAVRSFAYPCGRENPAVVGMVRQAGYAQAAVTRKKMRAPETDPFRVHRQIIPRGLQTWQACLLATRGRYKL